MAIYMKFEAKVRYERASEEGVIYAHFFFFLPQFSFHFQALWLNRFFHIKFKFMLSSLTHSWWMGKIVEAAEEKRYTIFILIEQCVCV
jgi:hypothetical protein